MITIDQARFFANLQLTQAYCERELRQEKKADWITLRSIINPVCKDGRWFVHMLAHDGTTFEGPPVPVEEWAQKSDPYHLDFFVGLFNKQLKFKNAVSNELRCSDTYLGKIVIIEYGMNIPDGAAEPETDGFFDEWDIPPIDTWFYNDYSVANGGILFAWIPEKFIELTDKAIEVQFLNILNWFQGPSSWRRLSDINSASQLE